MRLDDVEISKNVEDRRHSGGRRLGGRRGKGGILGLIIVLVGAYYGVDLSGVMGYGDTGYQQTVSQSHQTSAEEDQLYRFSGKVLKTTELIWADYFKQNGITYRNPKLVIYTGATPTACGTGQSAMGPFYCPADEKIYLDLSFYQDMQQQLRASGDFAFAYVIAHEVGHHVQNLLGISRKTQQAQQTARNSAAANKISVNVELQADCFAGVWGYQIARENRLDNGDIEEAFMAAEAVGDDRLQKRSQGYVVPDSFTHGSSAERLAWFRKGLQSGNPAVCNTFSNR